MAELAKDDSKTFSLDKTESSLLIYVSQQHAAVFAALLSNIAGGRLGYRVTENTQFRLLDGMTKMEMSEREPGADGPQEQSSEDRGAIRTAD